MKRTIYLSIFVVLSAAAGLLYYNHTRQATVLIANRDLAVGTSIQDADVALRAVNPGSLAGHMLSSPEQAALSARNMLTVLWDRVGCDPLRLDQ